MTLSREQPFPGLRPFSFGDSQFFFGREEQIENLYHLLELSGFVAVLGTSGSGKSSLVQAGLLPFLARETEAHGARSWQLIIMRPTDAPLAALADAIAAVSNVSDRDNMLRTLRSSSFGLSQALDGIGRRDGSLFLIVVDQFEEIFRISSSRRGADAARRDEATHFVQMLLAVGRDRRKAVKVLVTLRSDFIGDCSAFFGLAEAISEGLFLVPALTRMQLEEAVRAPIAIASAAIEPALVERLLNDAGREADVLAVFAHCLLRVWQHSRARCETTRQIEMSDYIDVGGMRHALSAHADEVMQSLPGLELAVEQVFRALSEVSSYGLATARAVQLGALKAEVGLPERDTIAVVDRFRADDCGFVVPDRTVALRDEVRVGVVHEALLRRWNRLSPDSELAERGWLAEEEADGRLYRAYLSLCRAAPAGETILPPDQIEERYKWWVSRPRTAAWADRYGGSFDQVERMFNTSLAKLSAEGDERRELRERFDRAKRRNYILSVLIAGIGLCAGVAGLYFAVHACH